MIQLPERFDDIRPYYDSEVPAAMQRIADDPLLLYALKFFGQEDRLAEIQGMIRSIRTTDELQTGLMLPICRMLVSRTIDRFSYDGVENVSPGRGQLFVSNHRDIVMDAYLLQLVMLENGFPSSHITFGSNLMDPQFVVDVGLSNKMFKTVRKTSNFQSFLESSIHLSDYINYVTAHGESVWIAQRNGRTKDGFDKTEPGLLRMLLLGADKRKSLEDLNITPVAVSYQWEPCDSLKALELYRSRDGEPYVKKKGEDLNSIITGVTSPTGNVHISICPPLGLDSYPERISRTDMSAMVREIDGKIFSHYRLWDTNYAAFDILNGTDNYKDFYSGDVRKAFTERMEQAVEASGVDDRDAFRELFLKIYAGPVISAGSPQ